MKRIFLIVLDSFGIGAMPDSEAFGDVGVNTLASCAASGMLNIPNMLAQISSLVSACGVNIESMTNKSRKDLAYTVLDVAGAVADDVPEKIAAIEGIIRVRVL